MAKPAANADAGENVLGDLYSRCVQLVNENKISTKNAFDLPLIDHIDDIVDSFMGGVKAKKGGNRNSTGGRGPATPQASIGAEGDENRFHEASCTIEASARIYACRVDCVHTDTYRVLGGLSSADDQEDDENAGEGSGGQRKRRRICGVNTLEKNENNIIQQNLESDEQSDPTFRRMAAAFDAGGAKGLLLGHLPLAEDLSLVFNGDIPLSRAGVSAQPMFAESQFYPQSELGYGNDVQAACGRINASRLCVEVDGFRQNLFGSSVLGPQKLPDRLEKLLKQAPVLAAERSGLGSVPIADAVDAGAMPECNPPDDFGGDLPEPAFNELPEPSDLPEPSSPPKLGSAPGKVVLPSLPLLEESQQAGAIVPYSADDSLAFDQLFRKFCGSGSSQRKFATTFEEEEEEQAKKTKKDGKKTRSEDNAQDGNGGAEKKGSKRYHFALSSLVQQPKPIETEAAHKHQLNEDALSWQLRKDVPPYMFDRITMPSWSAAKCDFSSLGLRPHLTLKWTRKPGMEVADPDSHSVSDLFSTVVVENQAAFPWLGASARGEGSDDEVRVERGADSEELEGQAFGGGLPSHMDLDPQSMFLRPDDTVLVQEDNEDMLDMSVGPPDFPFGNDDAGFEDTSAFVPGAGDFDLVDQPKTVGSTDISYSRNSKFVDVKLVKKHLLDCINDDLADAKANNQQAAMSFQGLVNRTVRRMPKGETENLSVAVCFICALHLCNEKGLELKVDEQKFLGDFNMVGPAK